MKPREYKTERRAEAGTAVIRVGAQGGTKVIAVYSNPYDAEVIASALNARRNGER